MSGNDKSTITKEKHFLNNLPEERFSAVLLSVDMVSSSTIFPNPQVAKSVIDFYRCELDSLINSKDSSQQRVLELKWQGDGGLFLIYPDNTSGALEIAEEILWLGRRLANDQWLVGNIPLLCLFRLLLHRSHFEPPNQKKKGNIVGDGLNWFSHVIIQKPSIGIPDSISISKDFFDSLPQERQRRCSPLPSQSEFYAYDHLLCYTPMICDLDPMNKFNKKLADILDNEKFDKVDILGHTGRTAFSLLSKLNQEMDIRLLLRHPKEEQREVFGSITVADTNKNPEAIRYHVETLKRESDFHKLNLSIRFYRDSPALKCIIFRNEIHVVGLLGVYTWSSDAMTYQIGKQWSGIILDSIQPIHEVLIDAFVKRFDHLWDTSSDVDVSSEVSLGLAIKSVWPSDAKYEIIYPVREPSTLPNIAYEDMMACNCIGDFLKDNGMQYRLIPALNAIEEPEGKVYQIFVCSRSLPESIGMKSLKNHPYCLMSKGERKYLKNRLLNIDVGSPVDADERHKRRTDYGVFARERLESGSFRYFVMGIHRVGTWAAARYATEAFRLQQIANLLSHESTKRSQTVESFSVVVSGDFDEMHNITSVEERMPLCVW